MEEKEEVEAGSWHFVDFFPDNGADMTPEPLQRSLHSGALHQDSLFIFGGYDGSRRINEFLEFNLQQKMWRMIELDGQGPSPRDRHISVVHNGCFYVFGGFNGSSRVNDFYCCDLTHRNFAWSLVQTATESDAPPSPRHSHSAVVHDGKMFVFGGYDGSYRSDFHAFDFETRCWREIETSGRAPRPRYRATCVVHDSKMYLFGGHDGNRHLSDIHECNLDTFTWRKIETGGVPPLARDSHIAVVYGSSMFVYGGSTGSPMDDFHELDLKTFTWSLVRTKGSFAGFRFCHVAAIYKDSIVIFGGYDGTSRLNDFLQFRFSPHKMGGQLVPPSTLISDLKELVNSELLSDVTFLVEGRPIYAHRVLCLRCPYFKALLTGEMMESQMSEISIEDVSHASFLALMEYLYTDDVEIHFENAMELFQAADQFGIERLKCLCETEMLCSITYENAASVLHAADTYSAVHLREKAFSFVLENFDKVSKTEAFEEMGRTNMELVFEVLRQR